MEYKALALEVLEDEDLDSEVAQYDTDSRVLALRLQAALVLALADISERLAEIELTIGAIYVDGVGVG